MAAATIESTGSRSGVVSPGSPEAIANSRTRAELLDEESYLRRSLEDLDREHAAGDIDIADYDQLRARYTARAGEVERELAGLPYLPPARPAASARRGSGRPRREGVVWAAAGCFFAAALIGSLALAGVAPFARSAPPIPVSARIQIELAEASVLVGNQEINQAVNVYADVLQLDPRQPEALADGGWLLRSVGLSSASPRLIASGDAEIALAVRADPRYELARAYDGVVLYVDDHDARAAVVQFDALAQDKLTASLVSLVHDTAVAAYQAVHLQLPAELASHK
jgi:hypothetical protein